MRLYPGVSIVTLGVTDIVKARQFYQDLGWKLSAEASNDQICFFALNNVTLALYGYEALAADAGLRPGTGETFNGVTLAQNYPSEVAVRMAVEEARAAGARILVEPVPTFWGGFHGVFADPDGHVWEIAHNPHIELTADGTLNLPA